MNRLLPDFVHVGSENNWPPLNLNGNDGFWGLNDDQFVVGSIKSSRALFCDELQAVLDSGSVSQSQSESCYSIQKTLSCPPVGEVAGISRKRNAESFKGGAGDLKMEKKKMKVYEEEESKFSKKNSNSNSNSKSTTTAADSCRKYPSSSKSDSYSKGGDAPKTDYIHVRARRGQATDSHSLAERVRREKISERMKYLQDLVPGCNKITGKAAMLDEIINYLQSLQRQIELLSMKLAAVSHHDMESNLPKEIYQPILPSSEVNNSGVHFHIHPVVQTPGGINVNTSDTFTDSQIQQFSWWNDVLPQSFTGEGFMGAGNVKLELP